MIRPTQSSTNLPNKYAEAKWNKALRSDRICDEYQLKCIFIDAYLRRSTIIWVSLSFQNNATVHQLTFHVTSLTKLQRGGSLQTGHMTKKSQIIATEIVDAEEVTLKMSKRLVPRLAHRHVILRLEQQLPQQLCSMASATYKLTTLICSAIFNNDKS